MVTLSVSGPREEVDEVKASSIINSWTEQLMYGPNTVTKVVLTGKTYTPKAAEMLANYLKSVVSSETVEVDLSDVIASRPEEEGLAVLRYLGDAFRDCDLQIVNLSDNATGNKGIEACEGVLNAQTSSLSSLTLHNMGLACESMELVARILTLEENGECACDQLKVLSFYNNMSGDEGCEQFYRILAKCKNLKEIRHSGCRAKREGSVRLGEALQVTSLYKLEKLDFSASSFFPEDGAIPLAQALEGATNLKYVNLRDCSFGSEGIEMVCNALIKAKAPLIDLDLSENEMGPAGAKALSDLLKQVSTTLRVFQSEENELLSRGVKTLVVALDGSALTALRLGTNECGHRAVETLCNASLPSLETLGLDGNYFPAEDVAKLEDRFGDALEEMEENDEEGEEEDEEEEEAEEEHVDELAAGLAGTHI